MELSIRSRDEFYDYLESELQNAAEKGREKGRKEGEEKTVVYFYKKGLIPRDVAIAKLGVTDQDFETLLQRYS